MSASQRLAEHVAIWQRRLREYLFASDGFAAECTSKACVVETWQRLNNIAQELRAHIGQLAAVPSRSGREAPPYLCRQAKRLWARLEALIADWHDLPLPEDFLHWDFGLSAARHRMLAAAECLLRLVGYLPVQTAAQLPLMDGLLALLESLEQSGKALCRATLLLAAEKRQVDRLARGIELLAQGQSFGRSLLEELAHWHLAAARTDRPILWLVEASDTPWQYAARRGWNIAQVLARVVARDDESDRDRCALLMAALLADAGMAGLPAHLMRQPPPSAAASLWESHVELSLAYARRIVGLPDRTLQAIAQHHEHADGTGFPEGRAGSSIAPGARLLTACDRYAALCVHRPGQRARSPRAALAEVLFEAAKGRLDAAATQRLLCLSFYPTGTFVELNDGRRGLTLQPDVAIADLEAAQRPAVRLLGDAPPAWDDVVQLRRMPNLRISCALWPEQVSAVLGPDAWQWFFALVRPEDGSVSCGDCPLDT